MTRLGNSPRSETRLKGIAVSLVTAAVALACWGFAGTAAATFKGRPGLVAIEVADYRDCDDFSIHLARPNLSHRRFLTAGQEPSFSPDGRKLIFTRACDTRPQIWQINVDGSDPHLLISAETKVSSASFSPDGQHIVFLKNSSPQERGNDVWIARADGTGERRLTTSPAYEREPVWSANGRYIVFARKPFLWTIRPDGSHARRLTRGRDADVSPDGHSIAFARTRWTPRFDAFSQLCVMRPGSGKIRVLAEVDGWERMISNPVFSPRSDALLYSRHTAGDLDVADVWSVKVNGHGDHRVRKTRTFGERSLDWQAR